MPDVCCAVGCTNRRKSGGAISFYRIPNGNNPIDVKRRNLWLNAIKRDKWQPNMIANARLCSEHFISGKPITFFLSLMIKQCLCSFWFCMLCLGAKSDDPQNPDYVPSIFTYRTQGKNQQKMFRYKRLLERREKEKRKENLCDGPSKENYNPLQHVQAEPGLSFQDKGICTSNFSFCRAVTRTLIGEGGVYLYIHVLPDELLFKSNSN